MSNNFVVGDQVLLNTGSERMNVEAVDGDSISCVWFDGKKELKRASFHPATLKKAPSADERAANMKKAIGAMASR